MFMNSIKRCSFSCFCTNEDMIPNSKEANFLTKRNEDKNEGNKTTKASSSSTSTSWLRFKDPRIVRVSRAFGGKDRHSKVCTVKGLRDRRVRLSVPTAIQLYDLQDRLGLNQPSKVVDWLLNAAKHEIDELPPLPITPSNFGLYPHGVVGNNSQSNKDGIKINSSMTWDGPSQLSKSSFAREKDVEVEVSSNTYFPSVMNNSYSHLEPSNFPLSHLGEDLHHNFNVVQLPSTLSLSTTQTYFPSHTVSSLDIDSRHVNHFQMMTSSSSNLLSNSLTPPLYSNSPSMRSIAFPFNVASRPNHSQERSGSQPNKDHERHFSSEKREDLQ